MIAVSMLTADAHAARSKNVPKLIPYGLLSTMSQQLAVAFHPVFLLLTLSLQAVFSLFSYFFFLLQGFIKTLRAALRKLAL